MSLVQSASLTRGWLDRIYADLQRLSLYVERKDTKYWTSFKNVKAGIVFSHCNPSAKSIRIFLPMAPEFFHGLEPSPSTKHWGDKYPSLYRLDEERNIAIAVQLLQTAYHKLE